MKDLTGAARKNPWMGVCWTIAAFSMVGLPFTGGLVSKLLLGQEAMNHSPAVQVAVLAMLALSTLLNVLYFLRTMLLIWSPMAQADLPESSFTAGKSSSEFLPRLACCVLTLGVLGTFFFASPLLNLISSGLAQF